MQGCEGARTTAAAAAVAVCAIVCMYLCVSAVVRLCDCVCLSAAASGGLLSLQHAPYPYLHFHLQLLSLLPAMHLRHFPALVSLKMQCKMAAQLAGSLIPKSLLTIPKPLANSCLAVMHRPARYLCIICKRMKNLSWNCVLCRCQANYRSIFVQNNNKGIWNRDLKLSAIDK